MKTDNELIHEFMGGDWTTEEYEWRLGSRVPMTLNHLNNYNTNWNWLMPVVEEINKLDDQIHLSIRGVELIRTVRKYVALAQIKDAHMYIVEFIKWYNEQK